MGNTAHPAKLARAGLGLVVAVALALSLSLVLIPRPRGQIYRALFNGSHVVLALALVLAAHWVIVSFWPALSRTNATP